MATSGRTAKIRDSVPACGGAPLEPLPASALCQAAGAAGQCRYPCATGTIAITYSIPAGVQGEEHPPPGQPYHTPGFPRTAFLPATREGRKVLDLLATAFRRRLLFTVGRSLSLGQEDCVTWAEVHHKTQQQGEVYGFPDPGYLARVRQELGEKGVREQAGEASGIKDGNRAERIEATKMTLEEQASINKNTSANNQTSVRKGFEGSNGFMPSQSSIRVA